MIPTQNLEFAVRPSTFADLSAVMEVNERTLPENYPLFFYEQILERYPNAFTVAYLVNNPKKIIGYIMWRVERGPSSYGLEYIKKGHLVSVAVLPQYRRKGVAYQLLKRSMEVVMKYEVSEYVLEVRVSNIGAVNLYEKLLGYKKNRIVGHYYRDGEDAFYMSSREGVLKDQDSISSGLTDQEIIDHYMRNRKPYICFHCPECHALLLKGLNYSFIGSIDPEDPSFLNCPHCNHQMSLYSISEGTFDIKSLKMKKR